MNKRLSLDTLGTMHDEIRYKRQVVEMSWRVREGVFWTSAVLQAYAALHNAPVPRPIAIACFPDSRRMIRDGHHRCVATYLGGREYLRHDEYKLEYYTYEMYSEINFEAGFVTPFDPRTEVRVPDFTAFREEVFRLYTRSRDEAIAFIRQNKARYARPHTHNTLAQLAESMREDALAAGIARGDTVADLALLGVSPATIHYLAASPWHIVSLQQLLAKTEAELLQIPSMTPAGYKEIHSALQRYHELEALSQR
jgi:hypothetical protein